jgi:carbonic anhydrase/acetyltransferase-like protein (isoleucine patch superfamily)
MILDHNGHVPQTAPSSWVAPNASVIGRVQVGPDSSIWYGAVVRADREKITIGARSNLQDGCVVHADPGFPTVIGDDVSVGHNATLHGCAIGDHVLVGMGATILNGATVGRGVLIAAGTLVLQGTDIPDGVLVAGAPGRVRRPLTDEERADIAQNATTYVDLALTHRT